MTMPATLERTVEVDASTLEEAINLIRAGYYEVLRENTYDEEEGDATFEDLEEEIDV